MLARGALADPRFEGGVHQFRPIGTFWAQGISAALAGEAHAHDIRVYRIPGLIAVTLAVLALYWLSLPLDRRLARVSGRRAVCRRAVDRAAVATRHRRRAGAAARDRRHAGAVAHLRGGRQGRHAHARAAVLGRARLRHAGQRAAHADPGRRDADRAVVLRPRFLVDRAPAPALCARSRCCSPRPGWRSAFIRTAFPSRASASRSSSPRSAARRT